MSISLATQLLNLKFFLTVSKNIKLIKSCIYQQTLHAGAFSNEPGSHEWSSSFSCGQETALEMPSVRFSTDKHPDNWVLLCLVRQFFTRATSAAKEIMNYKFIIQQLLTYGAQSFAKCPIGYCLGFSSHVSQGQRKCQGNFYRHPRKRAFIAVVSDPYCCYFRKCLC